MPLHEPTATAKRVSDPTPPIFTSRPMPLPSLSVVMVPSGGWRVPSWPSQVL